MEIGKLMFFFLVLASLLVLVFDIRKRKIKNAVVICIFLGGVVAHSVNGSFRDLGIGFLLSIGTLVIFVPLWLKGGLGAGDVKYLASVALWFDPLHYAFALVIGSLITVVTASFILIKRGRFLTFIKDLLFRFAVLPKQLLAVQPNSLFLPFGAFISIGVIISAISLYLMDGDLVWQLVGGKL